ncbi:hypothetical protein QO010_000307 [Caulobacter ginsengisoli]|uniref:Uncharacterized protein n=1 Tax=Caulobacter ginsengisoli TaxID=400775 RepID=A0ABU0IKS7_9CAUL|nr:hypothetical protein [Caulobacter ginsengisoli]MDQ0462559.1 hypothetical protein [Caulobacter ginsengisoli]
MVKINYVGLGDPKAHFEALGEYRHKLLEMRKKHRPFGTDFLILDAAIKALDTAAYHFTREPDFYAIRVVQSLNNRAAG